MYKLMKHQEDAITCMDVVDDGLLIAYDVGTGKTMIALSWIKRAYDRGEISNALIICPAALVGTWKSAIADCIKFEGFTRNDVSTLEKIITLSSYQKTYRSEKKIIHKKDGTEKTVKVVSLREEVDKLWDVVFCDESHNLGGHSSVQTDACITIAKHSKKRFAMSGTPLHGGGGKQDWAKMYGQIQFITADTKWRNWTDYCKKYVISYDSYFKPLEWDGRECELIFKEYTIACRREDCIELPPFTETDVMCELVERKMYKDILKGDITKYNITCKVAGTQYVKLLQIISGSCKTDSEIMSLRSSKDDAVTEILNGTDDKIIIFCTYTASVDRCARLAKNVRKDVAVYDGRSIRETWRDFQEGSKDVLVIQYDSGSAGLNLQTSSICVFFEPTLSALKLEQASGRIYRSGQKKKCTYYYLTTKNTIEEKVWRLVRSGKDVNNAMLTDLAHGEL